MVVVMQAAASEDQIRAVIDRLVAPGFDIHRSTGASQTVLGAIGVHPDFDARELELLAGVREVVRITQPYKLASRAFHPAGTITAIPVIKKLSHPPVMVDPSHATARRDKVTPIALATIAVGADGLLLEAHNHPEKALSDGAQFLYFDQFEKLMAQARLIAPVVGRQVA